MAEPIQLDTEPAKSFGGTLKTPELPKVDITGNNAAVSANVADLSTTMPGSTPTAGTTNIAAGDMHASAVIAAISGQNTGSAANASQSFGNIFTQTVQKEKESKLLTTVLAQKELTAKSKSILGVAPTLEKTIELEKELRSKHKLRFVKFLLLLTFLAGIGMGTYFYVELSPTFDVFGPNTTHQLTNLNDNLSQVQADVNKYRYLTAQLKLNEFSYQADRFFSNVAKKMATDENVAVEVEEAKTTLPDLLQEIRGNLTQDLAPKLVTPVGQPIKNEEEWRQEAATKLREALRTERKNFAKETNQTPEEISNLKLIDNALKLVDNKPFLKALLRASAQNLSKELTDYATQPNAKKLKNLRSFVDSILATTRSDVSTITDIKNKRINWSSVIKKIANETSAIKNANYGNAEAYAKYGGIIYNNYDFNAESGKIALSGISKTNDGTNFTLLSNLIQQLESSPDFEDVEMRGFAKTKSGSGVFGEAYTASFKIDLALQKREFLEKDRPSLIETAQEKPDSVTTKTTGILPGLSPFLEKISEFQTQIKLPFGFENRTAQDTTDKGIFESSTTQMKTGDATQHKAADKASTSTELIVAPAPVTTKSSAVAPAVAAPGSVKSSATAPAPTKIVKPPAQSASAPVHSSSTPAPIK